MFEGWKEFYLMAGGAAAVLIGLLFVVISLMQDRPRSTMLSGSRLYMGPILLSVSFALVLSAAALTPDIGRRCFAAIAGAIALWGLVRGLISTVGIARLRDQVHWTDLWFYGIGPSLLYLWLGVATLVVWSGRWEAQYCIASAVTALLLLAIRNEWDLITWIAPRSEDSLPPSL